MRAQKILSELSRWIFSVRICVITSVRLLTDWKNERFSIWKTHRESESARENVFHAEKISAAQLIRLFCCEPSKRS